MRVLLSFLLLAATGAAAQDYERERRWAAEVTPNLVVGDAVSIRAGREFLGIYTEAKNAKFAVLLVHGMGVHPDHGPLVEYVEHPDALPKSDAARWFVLNCIRQQVRDDKLQGVKSRTVNRFLRALPREHQLTLITDLVDRWAALGADPAMFDLLKKVAKL